MTSFQKIYKVLLLATNITCRKKSSIKMENKIWAVWISGIFLAVAILSNSAYASESTTSVNFTIILNNDSQNENLFNGSVENLIVEDKSFDWIYLSWDNPDGIFSNLISLDRFLIGNTSGEFFNITNLTENTLYDISIISTDNSSNYGPTVNLSVTTLSITNGNDDEENEEDNDNYYREYITPSYFSNDDSKKKESVTIYLNNGFPKISKSFSWLNSFLISISLAICILTLSISILIVNRKY